MPDQADFHTEIDALLRAAIKSFAEWAQDHWQMLPGEAETLTDPTPCPVEYTRGHNDAIASLPDAAELWLEGGY